MEKENFTEDQLIVRDFLARQRTTLANERTLLSYIRTALYFLVSGTALMEVKVLSHIKNLGYLGFGISIFLVVLGFINYFRLRRKLRKGLYQKM